MAKKIELKSETIDTIKHEALSQYNDNGIRISRIRDYYDMYRLLWDFDPPEGDWVQKLPSPEPHNAIKGMVRLMIGTEPAIKVRAYGADTIFPERAVKVCRSLLREADKRGPWIVSYDLSMSAALTGEAYVRCANVEDNVKFLERTGNSALSRRYRRLAREKPFVYRVYPPDTVFPVYSDLGLESITVRMRRPIHEIVNFWGEDAIEGLDVSDPSKIIEEGGELNVQTAIFWEYYGHDYRMVWVEGAKSVILATENKLGFINWAGSIVEGSSLFDTPEDQRLPMLYPVLQSGYWHAQSYADSIMYSLALNLGKLPQLVAKLNDPEKDVRDITDWSTALGVMKVQINEDISTLNKKVIDESLQIAASIAGQRMDGMLIPKQVLGSSPENVVAFSSLNLLVQAGRLPLVPVQRMVGVIMGHMLEIPWMWAKAKKKSYDIPSFEGEPLVIDPNEYEEVFVDVKLHAQFAQDDAQRVAIASNAQMARLWSRERAMEYTGVEEPLEEQAKIDDDIERMAEMEGMAQHAMQATMEAARNLGAIVSGMGPIGTMAPTQVLYRPAEDPIRMCGNCTFFQGAGVPCSIVAAAINPFYTCTEWQPNQQLGAAAMQQQGQPGAEAPPGAPPGIPQGAQGGVGAPGQGGPPIFNPNTEQGGGGIAPATVAPGQTREMTQNIDRGGNPITTGQSLPLG